MRPAAVFWSAWLASLVGCVFVDPFPDLAADVHEKPAGSEVPTPGCVGVACSAGSDAGAGTGDASRDAGPLDLVVRSDDPTLRGGPFLLRKPNGETTVVFAAAGNWTGNGIALPATGTDDIGLIVADADGKLKSARRIDYGAHEDVKAAAYDPSGALWIGGWIAPISGTNVVPLFAKLDVTGQPVVSAAIAPVAAVSGSRAFGECLRIGPAGQVFGAIHFRGTIQLTRVNGDVESRSAQGFDDSLVFRLDPKTGRVIWAMTFGAEGDDDRIWDLAVDASGDVYFTGSFDSAATSWPALTRIGTRGNAVVARASGADGAIVWAKQLGDSVDPAVLGAGETASTPDTAKGLAGMSIAVDGDGHVAAGGRYRGTVDFAGDSRNADAPGFYLLLLDSATGTRRWSTYGRGTYARSGWSSALAFDGAGHLAAAGGTLGSGTASIFGLPRATTSSTNGFAAELAVDTGQTLAARTWSSSGDYAFATSAAFAPGGAILVGINAKGTVSLGNGAPVTATSLDAVTTWNP